jgi:general secretion pathway protein H
VLVVVAIVGILALVLTLSVAGSEERRLTREAERFQLLVGQACAQAELSGREIGVVVSANGFAFRLLAGTDWQDAYADGELRPRQWIDGMRAELSREGRVVDLSDARDAAPQLVCFSSGELTPFALTLALGDAGRYRITGAEDGALKMARVESSR